MARRIIELDGETFTMDVVQTSDDAFDVTMAETVGGTAARVIQKVTVDTSAGLILALVDGVVWELARPASGSALVPRSFPGLSIGSRRRPVAPSSAPASSAAHGAVTAPMPGRVVAVLVAAGDRVYAGKPLVIVEAMKMQNELTAVVGGVVHRVVAVEGQSVERGAVLVEIEAS